MKVADRTDHRVVSRTLKQPKTKQELLKEYSNVHDQTDKKTAVNIPQIDRHLSTWLALHRDLHFDNNRYISGENLTLERIDAVASRKRCKYPWTITAAEVLGYTYYQYGHPLAISAAYYLHEWVGYSIQHGGLGPYATSKKAQADHSANEQSRLVCSICPLFRTK